MSDLIAKDWKMVNKDKDVKMEPAKTLNFNYKKYPDVMDAFNGLSKATDRCPHNAATRASIAIRDNIEDFLKFCRDHKVAI
jgi:hypothetical protein